MTTDATTIAPVRRELTVDAPIERAFDVFVDLPSWWPRETHHLGPTPADAVMEPFAGGRCFNRADEDGTETDWGRVLEWDPPRRVVFAWMITPRWACEPDVAASSEVEVRFTDLGAGRTHVLLEHRGFERYDDGGATMRATVDGEGGWGYLMGLFERTVGGA